ncbi:MAG: glycosyltransferase N-terminal domain-containing protein [Paracoccaceae bacterium]|nr:glycosyltransferase N-terminal domain-containing protein [Paracoccaceae bacterium]
MLVYRLILSLFAFVALAKALPQGQVAARLGLMPAVQGKHLWIHGASNGELNSARPVIEALHAARPEWHLVITCNSDTGVDLVRSWRLSRTTAIPAPLDLAWVTKRFFRDWHVQAHVTLESEIWPHRVLNYPGPVILLGGRMRKGTARNWGRLSGLARRVMRKLAYVSAQDAASLAHLRALGVRSEAIGPVIDLKSYYTPPKNAVPDAALREAFPRDKTWLAASTHPGEEAIVLAAFKKARLKDPKLRLILAPRHPKRGDEVAGLIREASVPLARRSAGDQPVPDAVYLADTMGEMALWYALAGRVFIGGTLTDRGGHTPYEPAAFGCAILHGSDVANFASPFEVLKKANAAVTVHDAASLAQALGTLHAAADQKAGGAAAQSLLRPETDLNTLVETVLAHLPEA